MTTTAPLPGELPLRRVPPLRLSPTWLRGLAIAVSLLLHALLFLRFGGDIGVETSDRTVVSVAQVTLEASAAHPQTQPPTPRRSAVGEQAVKPKPETRAPSEAQAAAQARQSQAHAVQKGLSADARQRYYARILAHIEAHKFYPAAARRRGQEGVVLVRFTLASASKISSLHVDGAGTVLLAAAREAVLRAVPFPPPPEGLGFPLELEVKIRYALKDRG